MREEDDFQSEKANNNDYTENDLAILKHAYTEWEDRQKRLWSVMLITSPFGLIISLLPAMADVVNFQLEKVSLPYNVYPLFGMVYAFISFRINHEETRRIVEIKECINENAAKISNKFEKIYKGTSTNCLKKITPKAVFGIQIFVSLMMIWSLNSVQ